MYFRLTNQTETHNGFQYKTGLNVDTHLFAESGSCVPGGLYFARKDIFAFIGVETYYVRAVTIPDDARWLRDPGSGAEKFRADRIVLGPRKSLWTAATIRWLIDNGADVHADNDHALRGAAECDHVNCVALLLANGANVHAENDHASSNATKST